jgi:AraC-like DNA-binding protein
VARGLDPEVAADRPAGGHLRRLAPVPARGLERLFADLAEAEAGALTCGAAYLLWRARAAFADAGTAEQAAVHPAVVQAVRLLHGDPGLAVSEVARTVGLSPDHLARRFRAEIGVGLAAWRERQRLQRVLAEADSGGRDLTDIALAAGFGSYSAFHRACRRRFGRGPRAQLRADQSGRASR